MNYHLAAIQSGEVTKTNVIGIRKALNANARRDRGLPVSSTAPALSDDDCDDIIQALGKHSPRVVGPLHDSGLKLLQSKRYAMRNRQGELREVPIERLRHAMRREVARQERQARCNAY